MRCPSQRQIKDNLRKRRTAYNRKRTKAPREVISRRGERVGSGAYGAVYGVTEDIVVKEMDVSDDILTPISFDVIRELGALRLLYNNENVVDLYRVESNEDGKMYNAYLQKAETTLKSYTSGKVEASPDKRRELLFGLFNGLNEMANRQVIHRDLKPENVGVTREGKVLIFDFGLSAFAPVGEVTDSRGEKILVTELLTSELQTLFWRSPEMLRGERKYTNKVDIWSAGIIMLEMFRKKGTVLQPRNIEGLEEKISHLSPTRIIPHIMPYIISYFFNPSYKSVAQNLIELAPELEREPDAIDLLERILKIDPNERLDIGGVLNHPYFAGFIPSEETLPFFRKIKNMDSYYLSLEMETIDERGRMEIIRLLRNMSRYERWLAKDQIVLHAILLLDFSLMYEPQLSALANNREKELLAYTCLEVAHLVHTNAMGEFTVYRDILQPYYGYRGHNNEVRRRVVGLLEAIDYDCYMVTEYHYLRYYTHYYGLYHLYEQFLDAVLSVLEYKESGTFTKCETVQEVIAQVLELRKEQTHITPEVKTGNRRLEHIVAEILTGDIGSYLSD